MTFTGLTRTLRHGAVATALAVMAGGFSAAHADDMRLQVYPGSLVSLPEYVGVGAGIYEKHGLNVTLLPIPTGPESIAAAASGSADAVTNSLGNTLLANGQGQDLVVVANAWNAPLFVWLKQPGFEMAGLDKPYPENLASFKGARVGVAGRGTETELFTRVLLRDAGIDPDTDVIWIPVGFGQTAIAAFEAKQADIMITMEPVQTILDTRETGEIIIDLIAGTGGPELFKTYPGVSRIAQRSTVEENPDLFAAYLAAHSEIMDMLADTSKTDEVAGIFAEASGQSDEIAKEIVGKYSAVWQNQFDCTGYENVLKYLVASGQFKQEQMDSAQTCTNIVAPVSQDIIVQ